MGRDYMEGFSFVYFKNYKSNKYSLIFQTRQPPVPEVNTVNPHRMVLVVRMRISDKQSQVEV